MRDLVVLCSELPVRQSESYEQSGFTNLCGVPLSCGTVTEQISDRKSSVGDHSVKLVDFALQNGPFAVMLVGVIIIWLKIFVPRQQRQEAREERVADRQAAFVDEVEKILKAQSQSVDLIGETLKGLSEEQRDLIKVHKEPVIGKNKFETVTVNKKLDLIRKAMTVGLDYWQQGSDDPKDIDLCIERMRDCLQWKI